MRSLIGVLISALAWGQGAQFEVVSVRPAQPLAAGTAQVMLGDGPAVIEVNPNGVSRVLAPPFAENGTVTLRYYTVRQLITAAYKEVIRDEYMIVPSGGGLGWLDADHFDLIAKTAPGTPVDSMRAMLQRALADRFHLTVHREQRPLTALVLTTGKNGAKLKPDAEAQQCQPSGPDSEGLRHLTCRATAVADLVDWLPILAPAYVDQPVTDATGLRGTFDFELAWNPARDAGALPGGTIFDALERLGLKLEERKQPMTVIVIDRAERPDEN